MKKRLLAILLVLSLMIPPVSMTAWADEAESDSAEDWSADSTEETDTEESGESDADEADGTDTEETDGADSADTEETGEADGTDAEEAGGNAAEPAEAGAEETDEADETDADEDSGIQVPALITEEHISYISGQGNGILNPNGELTRAAAAQILYNLMTDTSMGPLEGTSFSDVSEDDWYYAPVTVLASWGVIDGFEDGTFCPNDSVTREQFVKMLSAFFETESGADLSVYSDYTENWAYDYVVNAVSKGWLSGYPDGTIRQENAVTRAEAITIINRALGRSASADETVELLADAGIRHFTDLYESAWYYYDVLEATVEHTYVYIDEEDSAADAGADEEDPVEDSGTDEESDDSSVPETGEAENAVSDGEIAEESDEADQLAARYGSLITDDAEDAADDSDGTEAPEEEAADTADDPDGTSDETAENPDETVEAADEAESSSATVVPTGTEVWISYVMPDCGYAAGWVTLDGYLYHVNGALQFDAYEPGFQTIDGGIYYVNSAGLIPAYSAGMQAIGGYYYLILEDGSIESLTYEPGFQTISGSTYYVNSAGLIPVYSAGVQTIDGYRYLILSDGSIDALTYTADSTVTLNGKVYYVDSTGKIPVLTATGLQELNGELVYVQSDGSLMANASYNYLDFDENGYYTSGSDELDDLVDAALVKAGCDDDSLTQEEKLRLAYLYVRDNFTYLSRSHHSRGSTDWTIESATFMFTYGKGNCYCFAAAFLYMARRLGYDTAYAVSGGVGTANSDHAWVMITIDGTKYMFDVELEYAYRYRYSTRRYYNLYKQLRSNMPFVYYFPSGTY